MASQCQVIARSSSNGSEILQTAARNGLGKIYQLFPTNSSTPSCRLFKARVKRKRGDAKGARALSHSAKRIAQQFGDTKENEAEYPSKRGSTQRSSRVLCAAEGIRNDAWVCCLQATRKYCSSQLTSECPRRIWLYLKSDGPKFKKTHLKPLDNKNLPQPPQLRGQM